MIELRVAAMGSPVRARPTVPRRFESPLPDSLGTPARVGFSTISGVVAAALRDEVGDHAMEDRAVVVTGSHVFEEIGGGERGASVSRAIRSYRGSYPPEPVGPAARGEVTTLMRERSAASTAKVDDVS